MPVENGQHATRENDVGEAGGKKYQLRCGYFQDLK